MCKKWSIRFSFQQTGEKDSKVRISVRRTLLQNTNHQEVSPPCVCLSMCVCELYVGRIYAALIRLLYLSHINYLRGFKASSLQVRSCDRCHLCQRPRVSKETLDRAPWSKCWRVISFTSWVHLVNKLSLEKKEEHVGSRKLPAGIQDTWHHLPECRPGSMVNSNALLL